MPAGWTARRETGTGSVGDRTGNAAQIDYFTALGAPPHGTTTITVYVDESHIQGAFLHHWECTTWSPLPLTSARGAEVLAASVGQQSVLFNTSAAHFQVSWTIPGDQGDVMMTTPPTSVPRATFQADQLLFEQMRASFTPTPATPLVCWSPAAGGGALVLAAPPGSSRLGWPGERLARCASRLHGPNVLPDILPCAAWFAAPLTRAARTGGDNALALLGGEQRRLTSWWQGHLALRPGAHLEFNGQIPLHLAPLRQI